MRKNIFILVGLLLILGCLLLIGGFAFAEESVTSYENATALFNEVYVPYATRQNALDFESVEEYVLTSGYPHEIDAEGNSIEVFADLGMEGDSVYFYYNSQNEKQELRLVLVGYICIDQDKEVSRANYSQDYAPSDDQYHAMLGLEELDDVVDVDGQAQFLFGEATDETP